MTRIDASRREFLRACSLVSTVGAAGAPFALNLATMGAAVAQPTDYRALVCVFMFGGNDSANMVLPTDGPSWTEYLRVRTTNDAASIHLALPNSGAPVDRTVLPITPNTAQSGRSFALHPRMGAIQQLFNDGRCAIISNAGPLIVPLTRAQYFNSAFPKPRALYSHNDQQAMWQAFAPEGAQYGWGGRMGDLLASMNTNVAFTCVSAAGNAVWLSGQTSFQYQVGTNGGIAIQARSGGRYMTTAGINAFNTLTTADRNHLMEKEYNRVTARSIGAQQALAGVMTATAPGTAGGFEEPPFMPGSTTNRDGFARQLQTVARMISGRNTLGVRRQIFFVSLGGFDTHDNQNRDHDNLMQRVSNAIAYFDRLMRDPRINASNEVTLFTASDFGRTFTSNGDGTDHGWGAHHFVAGGAVRGRDIYGRFPMLGVSTGSGANRIEFADEVGSGNLIPQISVDELGATLARWFGVPEQNLNQIFPNLANFTNAQNGRPGASLANLMI